MKSFSIFVTICIGIAAANVVKRQATPPPPTLPPMKTDMMTSGGPMMTNPSTPPPPSLPSSMMTMQTAPSQPPVPDTTDGGAVTSSSVMTSDMPPSSSQNPVTMMESSTTIMTDKPTQPPTTRKPTIDELVSVDEILEVFGNVANSDYFKTLPYEDQLLVMEILAGGETGKMSAILDSVELKHLLTFMYNTPFKYADPLWRVIFLGYTREEIIAQ